MILSNRAQLLKPSPTLAMAAKARELAALGQDVVSLTVGEPDWPTSEAACQAGIQAIQQGFTKYTAAAGMPELRKILAKNLTEELQVAVTDQEVVVGAGAKFVIYGALQLLINPGDEVLIPSPYWVSYPTMVELAGGKPVVINCEKPQNFKLTPAQLKSAMTAKTKALILCSPSNPTGLAYSKDELLALAEVIRLYPNLVVISDDIYNRLMFSDKTVADHLLHVAPDLRSRLIAVGGASKTFSMTGWRIGWAACPLPFSKVLADYFSQTTSNVSSISQKAAIEALQNPTIEANRARALLRSRWDFFAGGLAKISGLRPVPADGAFYVWLDCQAWLGRSFQPTHEVVANSATLANLLLNHYALATVPGIEFGTEGYLRLSFATSNSDLQKALDRLTKFSKDIGL